MKNFIFCDFWGVPKEICSNLERVDGVFVEPFLESVDIVPVESADKDCEKEKIAVATMTNSGLNPDFYTLLLKKEKKLSDFGIKILGKAKNEFMLNYENAESAPLAIIKNQERALIYNIYNNIYSNIQYNIGGEKIRAISTKFLPLLDLANFVVKVRYLIKRYGEELSSTFIPKKTTKNAGVGFELSFIVESDKNLSDSFLAGLLLHAPEYAVFTNSCENSYVRLGGRDCAHYVCWGESADSLIKVKDLQNGIEITLSFPDASGNPYILLSALLEAGIMGVENQTKLPDKVDCLTPITQKELVRMPLSLSSALSLAWASEFMQKVLGEGLSHVFYKFKEREVEEFKGITTEDDYYKKYSEIL